MDDIMRKLRRVNSLIKQNLTTIFKENDLTGPQFFILKMIGCKGHMTVSEIADACEQDRPTISAMFNRLLDKGLVCKITNNDDRRSFNIELTKYGKDIVEEGTKTMKVVTKEFFSILTKEEMEVFGKILDKLVRRALNEEQEIQD